MGRNGPKVGRNKGKDNTLRAISVNKVFARPTIQKLAPRQVGRSTGALAAVISQSGQRCVRIETEKLARLEGSEQRAL